MSYNHFLEELEVTLVLSVECVFALLFVLILFLNKTDNLPFCRGDEGISSLKRTFELEYVLLLFEKNGDGETDIGVVVETGDVTIIGLLIV